MKTLKDLIVAQKIRKGSAHGTTKKGAFWLLEGTDKGTKIRSAGGDGIGQNSPDVDYWLDLRHYRSGEVSAVTNRKAWHQNTGTEHSYSRCDSILDCESVEDVIVSLKSQHDSDGSPVYSDNCQQHLTDTLTKLGLPLSAASPDE